MSFITRVSFDVEAAFQTVCSSPTSNRGRLHVEFSFSSCCFSWRDTPNSVSPSAVGLSCSMTWMACLRHIDPDSSGLFFLFLLATRLPQEQDQSMRAGFTSVNSTIKRPHSCVQAKINSYSKRHILFKHFCYCTALIKAIFLLHPKCCTLYALLENNNSLFISLIA